jgi:sarcosine oxidase subunit gamma
MTLKGPGAAALLRERGISVPDAIFQVEAVPGGGIVARTGGAEFFLEDGWRGNAVSGLWQALTAPRPGVYRVLRQDASMLLAGTKATELLAQTCSYDFRQPGPHLVMTRVAGVSCSILPRSIEGRIAFQLWVDGTYGAYLWHVLLKIAEELGGGMVGVRCFFPLLTLAESNR